MATRVMIGSRSQEAFLDALLAERVKQDAIWGGSEHDRQHPIWTWTTILRERIDSLTAMPYRPPSEVDTAKARRLFIEVAAVACAAFEAIT